jgi:methyl-accepting chemotaxis protein
VNFISAVLVDLVYFLALIFVSGLAIRKSILAIRQFEVNRAHARQIIYSLDYYRRQTPVKSLAEILSDILKSRSSMFAKKFRLYVEEEKLFEDPQTVESISEYIEPADLVSLKKEGDPLIILKTIPGLLIGAGIFGTFLGLFVGLNGIGSVSGNNISEITSRVDVLINGISGAFLTSIIGMLSSIISSLLLSSFIQRINRTYNDFVAEVDGVFLVPETVYNKRIFMVIDPESKEQIPLGEAVARMMEANERTVQSIGDMAERVAESIGDRIDSFAREMFSTFQGGAGEAAQEGANRARETFEQLVATLVQVAQEINPLVENLSSGLKQNIDNLYQLVEKLEDNIQGYDKQTETLGETLTKIGVIDSSFNSILESFDAAVDQIRDAGDGFEEVSNSTERSINTISSQWSQLSESVSGVLESLNQIQTGFSTVGDEIGGVFESITSGITEYQTAIGTGTERQLKEYHDSISEFSNRLANVATEIRDGVEDLSDTFASMQKQAEEFIDENVEEKVEDSV